MKTRLLLFALLLLPLIAYSQNVSIGDILCVQGTDTIIVHPQNYAGGAIGVVFYVDETDQHGWAVHLNYQGSVLWSPDYHDIPELPNFGTFREAINDFDGHENTRKIRQAGNAFTYPAAWAVDFEHGWYLPAAGQIRYLYGYIPEVNRSLELIGGQIFELSSNWWLWSSTECGSEDAWDINYQGAEGHSKKPDHYFYVRSITDF